MKLRLRLLVSFIAFALFTLLIFGTSAYQIAVDSAQKRETELLLQFVTDQAGTMTGGKEIRRWKNTPGSSVLARNEYLLLVAGDNGELRPAPDFQVESSDARNRYDLMLSQTRSGQKNGIFESSHQTFIWASAPIGTGGYHLAALRPLRNELASLWSTFGIRLVAAGIVIVWIAVWGALILAGLFVKNQEKHNAILIHQAMHDELTRLPKRNLLYDRLQQAIHQAQRARHHAALLIMDLDRFKEINDTLGHHSGDELLKQIGNRLLHSLRKSDTVARLGGDEFAILAPGCHVEQAVQLANKIALIMDPPHPINGMEVGIQPSIGIAVYPQHGEDVDSLIRHADVAMYQAKQQGGGWTVYASESDPHSLQRLTLMQDLRQAIESESLMLYYQPELDLSTGRVTGVEALARWNHSQRGLIPPDEFIGIAELSGQINALTALVLRQAFQQYHAWRRLGIRLAISINLSARNLHDTGLPAYIGKLLEAWNVTPSDIRLEITESAMLTDPAKAKRILSEFDAMGLGLAIDDFGTGYSSLAYLKQLPVNIIKIDKSFVMDMTHDEDDASIVRATIDLAHNLGLRVVAEGVETEEVLSALRELGCDHLQGYYISRPVPAHELTRWLATHHAAPDAAAS